MNKLRNEEKNKVEELVLLIFKVIFFFNFLFIDLFF